MAGLKGWLLDFLKDGLKDYLIEQLKTLPGRALWAGMVAGALLIWEPVRSWATAQVTASQWELALPYSIVVFLLIGGFVGGIQAQRKLKAAPTPEQLQDANDKLAEQQQEIDSLELDLTARAGEMSMLNGRIKAFKQERDQLKMQLAAKQATHLASELTTAKQITDLETAVADLQGQKAALEQALEEEMQANTGARARIKDDAAAYQTANAELKTALAAVQVQGQQRAAARKNKPILQDFKEMSVDGIHWRWSYSGPAGQQPYIYGMKPYCDACDFDLDLGGYRYNRASGAYHLTCPKCATTIQLPQAPDETAKAATAEVERIIRNDWWMAAMVDNEGRKERIKARLTPEAVERDAAAAKAAEEALGLMESLNALNAQERIKLARKLKA